MARLMGIVQAHHVCTGRLIATEPPMPKAPRIIPPQMRSELLSQVIRERWRGTDKALAQKANISEGSLSLLKNQGIDNETPSLRRVLMVLRLDAAAFMDGRLVTLTGNPEVSGMVDDLLGTELGPVLEEHIRRLHALKFHQGTGSP